MFDFRSTFTTNSADTKLVQREVQGTELYKSLFSMPVSTIDDLRLKTANELERLEIVAALEPVRLVQLMVIDSRVFEPVTKAKRQSSDARVEKISREEYLALKEAGFGDLLEETDWSDYVGIPISWGLRTHNCQINSLEIIERLQAILENGNDEDWKAEALSRLSPYYLAYALVCARDEGTESENCLRQFSWDDEYLKQIASLNAEVSAELQNLLRLPRSELYMRAMEEREEALQQIRELQANEPESAPVETVRIFHREKAESASEKPKTAAEMLAELRRPKT